MDSSTSDSDSASGEEGEADGVSAGEQGSPKSAPHVLQDDGDSDGESDVGRPGAHVSSEEDEKGQSEGEMASAVAEASHHASHFLQESDDEENHGQGNKDEALFKNVFGADSDDDTKTDVSFKIKKRHISSEGDDESDKEGLGTPAKKLRIQIDEEEEEDDKVGEMEEKGVMEEKEEEEVAEDRGVGEDNMSDDEEKVKKDDSEVGGEEEGGDVDKGSVGSEAEKESGDESEGEELQLQEEVAELVTGDGGEEEGGGGEEGGDQEEGQGSDEELEDDKKFEGMSDWDLMMQRRKNAMDRARRRRRRDGDLTVHDDTIMDLIQKMREAAEQDRQLNIARKAATKKIQFLPTIMAYLKKADLQTNFIECGILSSLAEWLTPLPDHSLPHLKIRETILDTLKTFPTPDSSILKSSKIGKAVMLLYQHPKETRKNREKAGKLINEWARPIFGLASDFRMMTRNEREERDYANLSQEARRRISTGERRKSQDEDVEAPQKPGDKGWVGRARVPMPSTKGYVVRPKWNTEQEYHKKGSSKKSLNRYEKHLRKKKQEQMQKSSAHAVSISVEGRHMPL